MSKVIAKATPVAEFVKRHAELVKSMETATNNARNAYANGCADIAYAMNTQGYDNMKIAEVLKVGKVQAGKYLAAGRVRSLNKSVSATDTMSAIDGKNAVTVVSIKNAMAKGTKAEKETALKSIGLDVAKPSASKRKARNAGGTGKGKGKATPTVSDTQRALDLIQQVRDIVTDSKDLDIATLQADVKMLAIYLNEIKN